MKDTHLTEKQLARKKAELTKLVERIRAKGDSLETERSYRRSVGRYIDFLCAHPWPAGTIADRKAEAFLTAEAMRGVSASTQNGSLHALCFYYREVRKTPLVNVDALRSKVGEKVRQAPSRADTKAVLTAVADSGPYPTRLICHLIYACGLRLGETLAIRLKDLDLDAGRLTIIGGKGKKDRFINLPPSLIPRLRAQVAAAEAKHQQAVLEGVPVKLPHLYGVKNPGAAFQRRWFWLFPMNRPCIDPRGEGRVWWRCLPKTVQAAMRTANRRARTEGITPHCLRHAWATHAAEDGAQLQDLRVILGHKNIETTARYVRPNPEAVRSPIETMDLAA